LPIQYPVIMGVRARLIMQTHLQVALFVHHAFIVIRRKHLFTVNRYAGLAKNNSGHKLL